MYTMAKTLLSVLILYAFFIAELAAVERDHNYTYVNDGCPLQCDCKAFDFGVFANCNGYLTEFPSITLNSTIINITDTNFSTIPNQGFVKAGNDIQKIFFINNRISNIEPKAFQGLRQLRYLHIEKNRISSVTEFHFQDLEQLETFNFIKNKLKNFDAFCSLSKLETLDLTRNNLSSTKFHACYSKANTLRQVSFAQNPIRIIQKEDFFSVRNVGLVSLSLHDCSLSSLRQNTFEYLQNLTILDLSKNRMTQLPDGIFSDMKLLNNLNLTRNLFPDIPESVLAPLQSLKSLSVGNRWMNKTAKLGVIFQGFSELEHLELNTIKLGKLATDFFENLQTKTLKMLSLSICDIHFIAEGAFKVISDTLEGLDLSENPLNSSALATGLFGLQGKQKLSRLNLNGLQLTEMDSSTFGYLQNVPELTFVRLEHAGIRILKQGTFSNFRNLRELTLRGNLIDNIAANTFENVTRLEKLDLTNCTLKNVPYASRKQIPSSLKQLVLDRNVVTTINSDAMKGLPWLEILRIRNSNIEKVGADAIAPLVALKTLDLRENALTTMSSVFTEKSPSTLEELLLKETDIIQYGTVTFTRFYNLKYLVIRGKGVKYRDYTSTLQGFIKPLHKLEKLELQYHGVYRIPDDMFSNNRKLKILTLSSNFISSWNPIAFKPVKKLRILALDNNRIAYVTRNSFEYLVSLRILSMAKNPLDCQCSLLWFRNVFLNSHNVFINKLDKKGQFYCNSPSNMKNKNLLNFKISDEDCRDRTGLILSILLPMAAIFVTMLVFLGVKYRWYLKYWLFLFRARKGQYIQLKNVYLYDAFVAYNHKDRKWIKEHLIPVLEHDAGYKLCLHERDWLAGPYIVDNIVNSIENSRKTILVLSPNFAESGWCQIEMKMAQHKLTDHLNVTIAIVLADIPQDLMTPALRVALTKKTYIKWPKSKNKEAHFWKGVIAALGQKNEERNNGPPKGYVV